MRRLFFALLWLAFVLYATVFAPPDNPDATVDLIRRLVVWDIDGLNPLLVAEFNLMGVIPLIFGCFLLADGRERQLQAWPFMSLMLAVGAFALLPYLVLRSPAPPRRDAPTGMLRIWDSRWLAVGLTVAVLGLVGYGAFSGDWAAFEEEWRTQRFIHVMTLDCLLLCALLPVAVWDDLPRRDLTAAWPFILTVGLPLLGSLAYLCCRSPLGSRTQPVQVSSAGKPSQDSV
jgi:hypothetical protein